MAPWLRFGARYLDVNGSSDDSINCGFSERIELTIFASHEIRFQDVPGTAIVLERTKIQLHRQVCTTAYTECQTSHLLLSCRNRELFNKKSPQNVGLRPPMCSQIF